VKPSRTIKDIISVLIPLREQPVFYQELGQISEELGYVIRDTEYISRLPMMIIRRKTKKGITEIRYPKAWIFQAPVTRRINIASVIHAILRTEYEKPGGDVKISRQLLEDIIARIIDIQEHGYYSKHYRITSLKNTIENTLKILDNIGVIKLTDEYVYYLDDNAERWILDLIDNLEELRIPVFIRNIKDLLLLSAISIRGWTSKDFISELLYHVSKYGLKFKSIDEVLEIFRNVDLITVEEDHLIYMRKKPLYLFIKKLEDLGIDKDIVRPLVTFFNYFPIFTYTKTVHYIYSLDISEHIKEKMFSALDKTIEEVVQYGFIKMGDLIYPQRVSEIARLFDTDIRNPVVCDIVQEIVYRVPIDMKDLTELYSTYKKVLLKVLDELIRTESITLNKLYALAENPVEKQMLSTILDILNKRKVVTLEGTVIYVNNPGVIKAVEKLLAIRPLISI